MKAPLLYLCLTLIVTNLYAQNQELVYDWETDRKYTKNINDESSALILLKNHFQYDHRYENENLVVYETIHKIYRANNDEALQSVNRIYIPLNNTIDITKVRARTITKSGKVIELDENNIKQVKDENNGAGYKIFAIEGGEIGSEIEFFYTKRSYVSYFGRGYYQFKFPVISSSFRLTSPENLKFDFKSYNGLAEVQEIDSEGYNVYELKEENIEPLQEESFSNYDANRKRLEYKLAYNTASGNQRLFTWSDAGKRVFEIIYPFKDTEVKAVKSFLQELKVKNIDNLLERFLFVEHHIKTNFYIDEQADDNSTQLDVSIKNRFTNKKGFARLMIGVLNELDITNEIIMTTSRSEIPFDGDFDTWNYLGEYLIYLPQSKQYVAPSNFETRVGYWPPEFSSVEGLFIKKMEFEGSTVPIAQVKKIPALPYERNFDNLSIQVSFSEELDKNIIKAERSFLGYNSNFVKLNYLYSDDEEKEEYIKNLIEFLGPGAEITKAEIREPKTEFNEWSLPITINGEFTSSEYIEQAGDILLFNVGGLIGLQSELYQENERKTNVENVYNRGYLRRIEIDLPKGYTIQNADDLNMNVKADEGGEEIFLFKSTYNVEGSKLNITIDEYYNRISFPVERFEEFRKVINAAADWNKITLVLEPNN
ncbi:DUF3857 domain-containing protein [Roseivirga misakiensis]|uniref:DUF3857 domain-containing protein n=1 Tax=Roseivirga misakiensis TaxID=1563681 RepID=A0A1E5SKP2_9BACT|nr:DUF3857 domain-containing protein [Roseivirga misakiensis]OEJ99698.1 hypothetical protein BFP71_09005 [Roseivirga misakiensis]